MTCFRFGAWSFDKELGKQVIGNCNVDNDNGPSGIRRLSLPRRVSRTTFAWGKGRRQTISFKPSIPDNCVTICFEISSQKFHSNIIKANPELLVWYSCASVRNPWYDTTGMPVLSVNVFSFRNMTLRYVSSFLRSSDVLNWRFGC